MSYKVLTDGNGSGLIHVIGLGDYIPLKDHQAMVTECEEKSKAIFDIMAERDGFAAQNIKMMQSISYCTTYLDDNKLNSIATGSKAHVMLADAITVTPSQCLAEIRAEAGRAGFIEGAKLLMGDREVNANEYAAKIRNTGTWLKDSNVNGGKRQGGDK